MISVLVITLAVEVPIDNMIANWTDATLLPDWQPIRAQWRHSVPCVHPVARCRQAGIATNPGRRLRQPTTKAKAMMLDGEIFGLPIPTRESVFATLAIHTSH
jgi:hypothetical protein